MRSLPSRNGCRATPSRFLTAKRGRQERVDPTNSAPALPLRESLRTPLPANTHSRGGPGGARTTATPPGEVLVANHFRASPLAWQSQPARRPSRGCPPRPRPAPPDRERRRPAPHTATRGRFRLCHPRLGRARNRGPPAGRVRAVAAPGSTDGNAARVRGPQADQASISAAGSRSPGLPLRRRLRPRSSGRARRARLRRKQTSRRSWLNAARREPSIVHSGGRFRRRRAR